MGNEDLARRRKSEDGAEIPYPLCILSAKRPDIYNYQTSSNFKLF